MLRRLVRIVRAAALSLSCLAVVVIGLPAAQASSMSSASSASSSGASAITGPVHWSFESGTLEGWQVISGSFGKLISDQNIFPNSTDWVDNEGKYYLSTMYTPTGGITDAYTGVIQSPTFRLSSPTVSMLVGGGDDPTEYVAACTADKSAPYGCNVLAKAQGTNSEFFDYRTLNLAADVGHDVFLQVVDEGTGAWDHVALSDVRANAPAMPMGLTLSRSTTGGTVSWNPVSDSTAVGYAVYRSTNPTCAATWNPVGEPGITSYDPQPGDVYRTGDDCGYVKLNSSPVQGTNYQDNSMKPDSSYYYRISSVAADGTESEGDTLYVPPADGAVLTGPVHWSFESGTLEGWHVVSGSFGQLIDARTLFRNRGTPMNKEGHYHLSTMNTPGGPYNDGYTGVIESPEFRLSHPTVSMLVGGGNDPTEYVAACVYDTTAPNDCREVAKTQGPQDEILQYRTLNLAAYLGQTMFIEVVDEGTGGWDHIDLDDVRANAPAMPTGLTVAHDASGVTVAWHALDEPGIAGYNVYRSKYQHSGYTKLTSSPVQSTTYNDNSVSAADSYFYEVSAVGTDGSESESDVTYAKPYQDLYARGSTVTYSGSHLTGIEFPVGPIGSGGILHFGDGTRNESWIFNGGPAQDVFQPRTQGIVPHSFFAVRVQAPGQRTEVRALQTQPAGPFSAMPSLTFQGEYPLASYNFQDGNSPVKVTEGVDNPMIPGDLKNSAIPTAIYNFTLKNTSDSSVNVSLLASQQNAVGFDGSGTIGGPDDRSFSGYGSNANSVQVTGDGAHLQMSGDAGNMTLSVLQPGASGTASWGSLSDLESQFESTGTVAGPATASSPGNGVTVDGALSVSHSLAPGASITVPVVLSWYFPTTYVRPYGGQGQQYTNWWSSASDVDQYVTANLDALQAKTQLYHDTMYSSNLPQYVLDRITAAAADLHTPTVFWAQNGFFGGWEGYGCCGGMPNHVWEYAQTAARLWPQVGQMWDSQWLDNEQANGLLPYRYTAPGVFAMDGQLGVILSTYRDYLNNGDKQWLETYWPKIKGALNYVITTFDPSHDGLLSGAQYNTYDSAESGIGPWMGSMYLAAVNASAHMASLVGDTSDASEYQSIYSVGRVSQESLLWGDGYYVEKSQNLPGTESINDGVDIDMLLGQWWSTQLGLGDIYNSAHMTEAEQTLFNDNFHQNFLENNPYFRIFGRVYPEVTDGGMMNVTWPNGDKPANAINYNDETWTGTEYEAAATMIQRGLLTDGLTILQATSDRYDGRLRDAPYIAFGGCGSGDGSGNPFGDVECGQWYSRSMSSWSVLLALQGFTYDAGTQTIGFAPVWQPADHESFFTAGTAWGTFAQRYEGPAVQHDEIQVSNGSLVLQHLSLAERGTSQPDVTVTVGNEPVSGVVASVTGSSVSLSLPSAVTITPGTGLTVTLSTSGQAGTAAHG